MSKVKVLVFGGNKFLGKYLLEQIALQLPSAQVYALTRSGVEASQLSLPEGMGFTSLACDRTNEEQLKESLGLHEFDYVFDASAYQLEHLEPALKLLKDRVGTWAFVSSAGIYAQSKVFPLQSHFAKTNKQPHLGKLQCEEALKAVNGLHSFCIRPVYIYGPHNTFDRESFFFRAIEKEQTILVPGDGQALLQFASVKDVAKLMVELALQEKAKTQHQAFHPAHKSIHSLNGIIEICSKVVGKEAKVKYFSVQSAQQHGFQLRDIFPLRGEHYFADISPLEALGLKANLDLQEGLTETYHWFKENRCLYPQEALSPAGQQLLDKLP